MKCACGCDGDIVIKPPHSWSDIPKYIHGHNSKGDNHPMKGKRHTDETKKRVIESKKAFSKNELEELTIKLAEVHGLI